MDFLKSLLQMVFDMLSQKQVEVSVAIPLGEDSKEPVRKPLAQSIGISPTTAIDWTNKDYQVSDHFTVGDCLTLHSWNRLATEQDGLTKDIKANLVLLCQKMEQIRSVLGCPINVHCMFRSQEYNQKVVGAIPADVHSMGMACDFDCGSHHTIDETHAILEPLLEQYGIRMERNTPTWVHIDIHPVKNARYFTA